MFKKHYFQATIVAGSTAKIKTQDGVMLDSVECNIGVLQGTTRQMKAISVDGLLDSSDWKVINQVGAGGSVSGYIAVSGAANNDQALRLASKYFNGAKPIQYAAIADATEQSLGMILDGASLGLASKIILTEQIEMLDSAATFKPVEWQDEKLISHNGDFKLLFDDLVKADINNRMLDSVTPHDIAELLMLDEDGMFDAVVIKYNQLDKYVAKVVDALKSHDSDQYFVKNVTPIAPFKRNGMVNVGASIEMSDTQLITVLFNNPDSTPDKLIGQDVITSWKWMLNNRDVTAALQPRAVDAKKYPQIAKRILMILAKNQSRFGNAQKIRLRDEKLLAEVVAELEAAQLESRRLDDQLALVQTDIENDLKEINSNTEVGKIDKAANLEKAKTIAKNFIELGYTAPHSKEEFIAMGEQGVLDIRSLERERVYAIYDDVIDQLTKLKFSGYKKDASAYDQYASDVFNHNKYRYKAIEELEAFYNEVIEALKPAPNEKITGVYVLSNNDNRKLEVKKDTVTNYFSAFLYSKTGNMVNQQIKHSIEELKTTLQDIFARLDLDYSGLKLSEGEDLLSIKPEKTAKTYPPIEILGNGFYRAFRNDKKIDNWLARIDPKGKWEVRANVAASRANNRGLGHSKMFNSLEEMIEKYPQFGQLPEILKNLENSGQNADENDTAQAADQEQKDFETKNAVLAKYRFKNARDAFLLWIADSVEQSEGKFASAKAIDEQVQGVKDAEIEWYFKSDSEYVATITRGAVVVGRVRMEDDGRAMLLHDEAGDRRIGELTNTRFFDTNKTDELKNYVTFLFDEIEMAGSEANKNRLLMIDLKDELVGNYEFRLATSSGNHFEVEKYNKYFKATLIEGDDGTYNIRLSGELAYDDEYDPEDTAKEFAKIVAQRAFEFSLDWDDDDLVEDGDLSGKTRDYAFSIDQLQQAAEVMGLEIAFGDFSNSIANSSLFDGIKAGVFVYGMTAQFGTQDGKIIARAEVDADGEIKIYAGESGANITNELHFYSASKSQIVQALSDLITDDHAVYGGPKSNVLEALQNIGSGYDLPRARITLSSHADGDFMAEINDFDNGGSWSISVKNKSREKAILQALEKYETGVKEEQLAKAAVQEETPAVQEETQPSDDELTYIELAEKNLPEGFSLKAADVGEKWELRRDGVQDPVIIAIDGDKAYASKGSAVSTRVPDSEIEKSVQWGVNLLNDELTASQANKEASKKQLRSVFKKEADALLSSFDYRITDLTSHTSLEFKNAKVPDRLNPLITEAKAMLERKFRDDWQREMLEKDVKRAEDMIERWEKQQFKEPELVNGEKKSLNDQPIPNFETYQDALAWIDEQGKKFGGKRVFTSSALYKAAFPLIDALYKIEKANTDAKKRDLMRELGFDVGDRVKAFIPNGLLGGEEVTGTVVTYSGTPMIKTDQTITVSRNGKLSQTTRVHVSALWHSLINESAGSNLPTGDMRRAFEHGGRLITPTYINGKQAWTIQTTENREKAARGERVGFGDYIEYSEDDAIERAKQINAQEADKAERDKKNAEQAKAAEAKAAEDEKLKRSAGEIPEVQNFVSGLEKLQADRVITHLSKIQGFSPIAEFATFAEGILKAIHSFNGQVEVDAGEKALSFDFDGQKKIISQKGIGKIGIEFAEFVLEQSGKKQTKTIDPSDFAAYGKSFFEKGGITAFGQDMDKISNPLKVTFTFNPKNGEYYFGKALSEPTIEKSFNAFGEYARSSDKTFTGGMNEIDFSKQVDINVAKKNGAKWSALTVQIKGKKAIVTFAMDPKALNAEETNMQKENNTAANDVNSAKTPDELFLSDLIAGKLDLGDPSTGDKLEQIGENLEPSLQPLFDQAAEVYADYSINLQL